MSQLVKKAVSLTLVPAQIISAPLRSVIQPIRNRSGLFLHFNTHSMIHTYQAAYCPSSWARIELIGLNLYATVCRYPSRCPGGLSHALTIV